MANLRDIRRGEQFPTRQTKLSDDLAAIASTLSDEALETCAERQVAGWADKALF